MCTSHLVRQMGPDQILTLMQSLPCLFRRHASSLRPNLAESIHHVVIP